MAAGLEFSIFAAIIDRRYSAKKLVVTQTLKPCPDDFPADVT